MAGASSSRDGQARWWGRSRCRGSSPRAWGSSHGSGSVRGAARERPGSAGPANLLKSIGIDGAKAMLPRGQPLDGHSFRAASSEARAEHFVGGTQLSPLSTPTALKVVFDLAT